MSADEGDQPARSRLDSAFLDISELGSLPTSDPLIEGVLDRHTYGVLRGRDGTCKSFLALDWALCVATGTPWMNRRVPEPGRVLYVAAEGAYGLRKRVAAWSIVRGVAIPSGPVTVRTSAVNLFRGGREYEHLLDHVRERNYSLIILDTLRRMSGGARENGSDMGVIVDRIDELRRLTSQGTVLAVAHTAKDDVDTRGYSGIEDDADFVWHLRRTKKTPLELGCTKQKDRPSGEVLHLAPVEVDLPTGETSLVLRETSRETATATAVDDLIRALDDSGLPATAGRDRARAAVQALGLRVSNQVLTEAVRRRKPCPGQVLVRGQAEPVRSPRTVAVGV